MEDLYFRDDAPLTGAEWESIDETVARVAQKLLVARRVVEVFGPLGAGTQTVQVSQYRVQGACLHCGELIDCGDEGCSCESGGDCDPVDVERRQILELPLIHKDFVLRWRDIATSRQFGLPLEVGPAAAAASAVARKEDEMIFGAMLEQEGATTAEAQDWGEPGSVFANMVKASEALAQAGFFGPYAVVVSPSVYAMMHRPMQGGMGMLEIKQIKELAAGGVYQTPALKNKQALMISQGMQNMDLALAEDISTAYLGPEKLQHYFRVMESLVLRVKRPQAICVIG